jgi:hypothetical protein
MEKVIPTLSLTIIESSENIFIESDGVESKNEAS